MRLKLENLHPTNPLPTYKHGGDSGFDLHAAHPSTVRAGQVSMVSVGLKAEIPSGYEIQIRARSSLAQRGVLLTNGIGTIDEGYRGEWYLPLTYLKSYSYQISEGDRIAQAVLVPVTQAEIVEGLVTNDTSRGEGGFGSTGT